MFCSPPCSKPGTSHSCVVDEKKRWPREGSHLPEVTQQIRDPVGSRPGQCPEGQPPTSQHIPPLLPMQKWPVLWAWASLLASWFPRGLPGCWTGLPCASERGGKSSVTTAHAAGPGGKGPTHMLPMSHTSVCHCVLHAHTWLPTQRGPAPTRPSPTQPALLQQELQEAFPVPDRLTLQSRFPGPQAAQG